MSNAGPLTTTFTAPSVCATATGLYQIWPGGGRYYYGQGPLGSRTECFPSGYDASPSQHYSPGLCPSGYTPACSSTDIISSSTTETAYTCCPTAATYTCAGPVDGVITSGAYLGCTTTFDRDIVLARITAISDGSTEVIHATTESSGAGLGANSVAVRFRSGDLQRDVSPSASVSLAASGTATLPVASSTSLSAPNTPGPPGSASATCRAITTNQAIGISIGSGAAALVIAISVWLFFDLRRRKQMVRAQIETPIPPPAPPPKDRRFRSPIPQLGIGGSGDDSIASVARSVSGKMIRGPFQLQSEKKHPHGMPEGHHSSPSRASRPKSSDPPRSNPMTPSLMSPPSSFGFQPAESESPPRSVTSAGSGYIHGRSELASP